MFDMPDVSAEVSDDVMHGDGYADGHGEGHGRVASPGRAEGANAAPAMNADATTGAGGRVAFARALERDAECRTLGEAGLIVVEIEGIGSPIRGRLGDVIDEAIERELEARGAAPPGLSITGEGSDRDAALGDQLFRARRIGAPGIAVVLGPLRAAAGPSGALDPEDSAALRFLAGATRERSMVVLLDERDASTFAYAEPVSLASLIAGAAERLPPPAPGPVLALTPPPEPVLALEPPPEPVLALAPSPALDRHTAGATIVDRDDPWRTWTLQLVAARGPQPLAVLERLFTDCYMPLANAVAEGLDDPRARAAAEEFRTTFTRGYTEAFATFAATTKRPRMVLDVHDTASRIARLHGARSTRMLLVDAMRWDMSQLIEQRLTARLGVRAVVTDEVLLWSALPTTTMRQLETIARGIEALRAPGEMDADAEPPRGRTAEYVRRLRVGPRELHKLDVIESRLQGARGGVLRALPEIADVAAETIARHVQTLAPNTLLFVFGDHGFTIDRTGSARQGGASPEEVLVGAFALLVGDVH
ncbi:MAG TPA: hypothetical protein VH044_13640 [Polyangiaceae bacterium]|jgi:hypothetical protein|nr:hypothetical protein [Polyangiaceae bacterium]